MSMDTNTPALRQLHHDLVQLIGVHAYALTILLKARDGGVYPERWRSEIELLLAWGGMGHPLGSAPTFTASGRGQDGGELFIAKDLTGGLGELPQIPVACPVAGHLLVWAQLLRQQLHLPLLNYNCDPLQQRTRAWLMAQVGELCELAGVPRRRKIIAGEKARRRIAARWGVPSTRHLPTSVLRREVTAELLRLELAWVYGGATDAERQTNLKAALGLSRVHRDPVRVRLEPNPDHYPEGYNDLGYRYAYDQWLADQGVFPGSMAA